MRTYKTSKQNVLYGNDEYIKTHTREEIMEKFNVDYNTLNNFCHKVGIRPIPKRKNKYDIPEGFEEYAKEHSLCETARYFNIAYTSVLLYCRKNNIKYLSRKPKVGYKDNGCKHSIKRNGLAQDMIRELSKIFTNASIARVFGYSQERIRQICMETAE